MQKENFKKVKEELGLTTVQIAARLNIPYRTLVNYETGLRDFSNPVLSGLHVVFGINLNWFFTGHGSMFLDRKEVENAEIHELISALQKKLT
jgi:transcriptional regulator with XRE-family HTH domain